MEVAIEGVGHTVFASDVDCILLGGDVISATDLFGFIDAEVLPMATSEAFKNRFRQGWESVCQGYQRERNRQVPKAYRVRISIALLEELSDEDCEKYWKNLSERCVENADQIYDGLHPILPKPEGPR